MEIFNFCAYTNAPKSEIIEKAYQSNSIRELEDEFNIRVIVSDESFIYVTDIPVYEQRRKMTDIMIGSSLARDIFLRETWIHKCKTRDDIIYTIGNIYGASSIIMGPRYANILKSTEFQQIVGRKLKNVSLTLIDDQYKLNSYEFRD
jgi:hypothetical protein